MKLKMTEQQKELIINVLIDSISFTMLSDKADEEVNEIIAPKYTVLQMLGISKQAADGMILNRGRDRATKPDGQQAPNENQN